MCGRCGRGEGVWGNPPACYQCDEVPKHGWTITGFTSSCTDLLLAEQSKRMLDVVEDEAAEEDDPCGTGCIIGVVAGVLTTVCCMLIGCMWESSRIRKSGNYQG